MYVTHLYGQDALPCTVDLLALGRQQHRLHAKHGQACSACVQVAPESKHRR